MDEPTMPAAPERPPDEPALPRVAIAVTAIICVLIAAGVYVARLAAPNDLFRRDQAKTMAYTVDVVLNGRYSLPRDPIFQPATKPPLYNWLAASFVGPTGVYDEWAHKWPSLVGAVVIAAMVFVWCRRNFAVALGRQHALLLAMLAAAIWMGSRFTILLLYIARPDMVQAACLIAAWLAGHAALKCESKREARPWAALFWVATSAAALAKGPAAVYPIVYVLLAAPLIFGDWRRLRNLYWVIGLLTLLGSVGLWLACAARQDWPHVRDVLLGSEVAKRIATSRIEGGAKPAHYAVMWWLKQNTVWSYLAIGSMVVTLLGSVRWLMTRDSGEKARRPRGGWERLGIRATEGFFTGAAGAANLWTMVVVGCLTIPKDKRQDFLLPSHPATAILAAHFVVWLISRHVWARYLIPIAGALFYLWQKRNVPHVTTASFGVALVGLVALVAWVRSKRESPAMAIAGLAVVGFLAFEIATNTRFGFARLSPTLGTVGLVAGAGAVASLFILSFPRARLELPFIACGIAFWTFALLQNTFKDSGLPGHDGGPLQRAVARLFDPSGKASGTNPSVSAARFAKKAQQIVGDDKVVSLFRSKSPILSLMGRHQGGALTRADFEQAKWVIVERSKFPQLIEGPQELAYSGRVDVSFGHVTEEVDIYKDRVALFRVENGVPSVEQMISIHRWVNDWTTEDANPYRSPNTGWIASEDDPPIWTPPPGDPWMIDNVRQRMRRPTTTRPGP